MKYKKIWILLFLWSSFFLFKNVHAQSQDAVGSIANVLGEVDIKHNGVNIKAKKQEPIYETDVVVTHKNSAVKINFKDGSNYMAFSDTEFKLSEYKLKSNGAGGASLKSVIDNVKGNVRFFVKPKEGGKNDVTYKTPNAVMLVRGTSGDIDVKEEVFSITEGTVQCALKRNLSETKPVPSGFSCYSKQFIVVRTPAAMLRKNDPMANKLNSGSEPGKTSLPAGEESGSTGSKAGTGSGSASGSGSGNTSGTGLGSASGTGSGSLSGSGTGSGSASGAAVIGAPTTGGSSGSGTTGGSSGAPGGSSGAIDKSLGNIGGAVGGAVGNVGGAVGGAAGNAGGAIGGAVGNVGGSVGGAVGNVGGNIGGAAGNIGGNIGGAAGNIGGNIGGAAGNVGGNIGGAAGNVGGAIGGSSNKQPILVNNFVNNDLPKNNVIGSNKNQPILVKQPTLANNLVNNNLSKNKKPKMGGVFHLLLFNPSGYFLTLSKELQLTLAALAELGAQDLSLALSGGDSSSSGSMSPLLNVSSMVSLVLANVNHQIQNVQQTATAVERSAPANIIIHVNPGTP
ncbi:MAG: hypothetical protein V4591_12140 [Bdellovibrionota bacterium]